LLILQLKDVVCGAVKNPREGESEFEAWNVAVALDGVDALAGDTNGVGKLLLGPASDGAEFLDAI
jgi:hypothetical protein